MKRKEIHIEIVGLGLMGQEIGSSIARWCNLLNDGPVPVIKGICNRNPDSRKWYIDNFPEIEVVTNDYKVLLESDKIDAIYCAVPHNMHEQFYIDIINAKKHLLA